MPKVKYWSSSPTPGPNSNSIHMVMMTVTKEHQEPQNVRIATCINGAVSKRIAELLDKEEGQ